jgi:hypothetical protein
MGTRRVLASALAIAALASGCEGSKEAEPEAYALAPSRACLAARDDVRVDAQKVDFVASTALGGAMRIELPATDNFVVVSFGDDDAEAARIEHAYREFAGQHIPIDDVLQRTKNVVLVWNGPPGLEERETVLGCLRADG